MAPHGVYPSAGDDEWVADRLSRRRRLAGARRRPRSRTISPHSATAERLARRDELDELVAAWTAPRPPQDAAAAVARPPVSRPTPCRTRGSASPTRSSSHLEHWVTLPHPDHGTIIVEGCRAALSDTPAQVTGIPPQLGQDTVDILLGELGYDDVRLGDLFAANALD